MTDPFDPDLLIHGSLREESLDGAVEGLLDADDNPVELQFRDQHWVPERRFGEVARLLRETHTLLAEVTDDRDQMIKLNDRLREDLSSTTSSRDKALDLLEKLLALSPQQQTRLVLLTKARELLSRGLLSSGPSAPDLIWMAVYLETGQFGSNQEDTGEEDEGDDEDDEDDADDMDALAAQEGEEA